MEPRRCQVHGLVLNQDGKCLICARGREHAQEVGPGTSTGTYLVLILGVLIVGTLVLGGMHFMSKGDGTPVTSIDEMVSPDAAQASEPVDDEVAPPPPPPRRAPRTAFNSEAGQRRPGGEETRSAAKLESAMREVKITMYSTTWCGVCKAARRWLKQEGYQFTDLDVEASRTDSILHKSLNPRGSVPTFDIEGTVLVGFNERSMLQAIKTKAEAKLE